MSSILEQIKSVHSFEEFNNFDCLIVAQNEKTKEIVFYNDAYKNQVETKKGANPDYKNRFISIESCRVTIDKQHYTILVSNFLKTRMEVSTKGDLRKSVAFISRAIRDEVHNDFINLEEGKTVHEKIIDEIAFETIEFYGSKYGQIYIFPKSKDDHGHVYEYRLGSSKVISVNPKQANINVDKMSLEFLENGYSLICHNIEFFTNINRDLLARYRKNKIDGFTVSPLFAEGKLIGIFIISRATTEDRILDPFLFDYSTNAIGLMVYRGELFGNIYYNKETNLYNTGVIANFYPSYLEKNAQLPIVFIEFGVLYMDSLTRLHGINKVDKLLRGIADILRRKYPNEILSYQEGTNTFNCVTTGVAENIALEAKNIQKEVNELFPDLTIELAFGIYQLARRDEQIHDSKTKCSYAFQYAIEHPNTRICIYDNTLEETKAKNSHLLNNFYSSIKEKKFKLYIQPKYNNERNTYYGGEALARWELNGKTIMPVDFIPLFEAHGFIKQLDLYILEEVCRNIQKWIKEDPHQVVPISVNLSRIDFSDTLLFEKIMFIINEYKIPHQFIELEITESVFSENEAGIIAFMEKCHDVGLKILMDDFGSGESSFNSLKNLDIDGIKLDYKFLSKEGDNLKKRKIIESIVSLARAINVFLVVEGVETRSEASYFKRIGVRHMQGYLFGKPMPVEEFEKINNKTAEYGLRDISDSRLFLNDILDTESNVNALFNEIRNPIGVAKLEQGHLYFVMVNNSLRESLSRINHLNDIETNDIASFLSDEDKKKLFAMLQSGLKQYKFTPRRVISFKTGFKTYLINFSCMLVKQKEEESYYIFDALILNSDNNESLRSVCENDLDFIIDSKVEGCALFDENFTLVKTNEIYNSLYPDKCEVGYVANEPEKAQLVKDGSVSRTYIRRKKSVYEIEIKHYIVDEKRYILAKFRKIGVPTRHVGDLNNSGYQFLDRFLSTCQIMADYYIEIDLDNDTYVESRLDNPFNDEDVLRLGCFSKDILKNIESSVSAFDQPLVKQQLDIDSLKESSHIKTPKQFTFKLKKQKVFYRVHMKFFFDGGRSFACMFLENVTSEKIKDYDVLTECMSRTSGISLINKHIKDNPVQKMALIILDLDDFKLLNDTYGHPLGDKVLAQMHSSFKKLRSDYNFGTRLGGDEFAILLRDRGDKFSEKAVIKEIEHVLGDIGKQVGLDQVIHASYGIALIPEDGVDFNSLYSVADNKLYNHKNEKKVKR